MNSCEKDVEMKQIFRGYQKFSPKLNQNYQKAANLTHFSLPSHQKLNLPFLPSAQFQLGL